MIKFIETGKRKYTIKNTETVDGVEKEIVVCNLDLMFSPVTNKFERLTDFVEDCSVKLGSEFDTWFVKLISDYKKSKYDYNVIRQNIPELKRLCDKYLDQCNVNFDDYINRSKISKNSIFFDATEIKKIIQASNYLKLYFIIATDNEMKLVNKFHKETYNKLIEDINSNNNIIYKLFKICSSKTFEYSISDKYMWDYIKAIYCKTTDMHVFSIFNFVMNNILVTCNTTSNPIPYLISVIDTSISWILKNIYKDSVIYSDCANTQDVYTIQGKDNLASFSHNDTIGKLLIISYNQMDKLGIADIEKFNTKLQNLKEVSLFANYVTYPILSKVLEIPYRHLLTLSVSNAYLLNSLMYTILPDDFKKKYPQMCKMLLYYNKQKPILKTTYKIKSIDVFTETMETFLSFKSMTAAYDIYSSILGRISRNVYVSINNEDHEIMNFPLAKLEIDMVKFYNEYFANKKLDDLYDDLRTKIDNQI